MSGSEVLVDVRGLPPPEPMERVLDALDTLTPGQMIRMLLHREPYPLYELLAERGYTYEASMQADGSYVILIREAK